MVSTGVFNFTLVHNSVTLGLAGSFGAAGGFGTAGVSAGLAPGAPSFGSASFGIASFGMAGLAGGVGMAGLGGAGMWGNVKRLPSTSWPSIIDLPRCSTCISGGFTAAAEPGGAPGGEIGDPGGGIGIMLASFFR